MSLPPHADIGNCGTQLSSGSTCSISCTSAGYSLQGAAYSCANGVVSGGPQVCSPNPCSAALSTAPSNGDIGTCGGAMVSGSSCSITCSNRYSITGPNYQCAAGTITGGPQSCAPLPCSAPVTAAPSNGMLGSCGVPLASGASCSIDCAAGYSVIGSAYSCSAGVVTGSQRCEFTPVPALSCSVNTPSSSNPCCSLLSNLLTHQEYLTLDLSFLVYDGSDVKLCLESNAANTADAQQNQARIDKFTSLYDTHNCWGGEIAQAAGSGVESLRSRQDYARRLQRFLCEAHFRVDGDWSAWSSWTECQSHSDVSARSRTCNNPLPAMGGAACAGLTTEQKSCAPPIVSSSAGQGTPGVYMSSSTAGQQTPAAVPTGSAGSGDISAAISWSPHFMWIYMALPLVAVVFHGGL